ncbi:MAG: trigger factor [Lachnospiraceae bacterium]|nr:trigger factor [Lachnospiraceae bacterium]
MKRKLLAMGLAAVMVFSVCACGKEEVSSDTVQTGEQTVERDSASESSVAAESTEEATSVDIAELDMSEYVTLNQYDGMTVQVSKTEVTDENTEYYINNFILTSYAVTDRAVATGDVVLIDYVGKKDGVAFEGGSYEGYELAIGSGTFIPGFEDGLVGVMPGTTVDLNITFPEDYGNTELAGQPVVFTVTVHSISATAEYATVTPEQMAAMGLAYQSKEELWEAGKELLTQELELAYESNVKGAIFTKLFEESQVTTAPAYLVEEELNGSMAYMEMICMAYYQCDLETYVTSMYGMTVDEFKEQMRTTAEETVKQYLVIEATAKDMGIELTEEEFMSVATADAAAGGYASVEEYLNEAGRTAIRATLLYDKVMEELLKCVVVEDIVAE